MKCKALTSLLLVIALLTPACLQAADVRTVALSGQQAPGTPDGVVFTNFNRPQMNALGEVSFASGLEGSDVGVRNRQGLWSESFVEASPTLSMVARLNDQAPETTPGIRFSSLSEHFLSDASTTSMAMFLVGRGIEKSIYSNASGQLNLIARENDPAPNEAPGFTYSDVRDHRSNGLGQLAFTGAVENVSAGTGDIQKIWRVDGGVPTTVARGGDLAPGAGDDLRFTYFSRPTLNSSGELAFLGNLNDLDPNTPQRQSIWSNAPGALTMVARAGESGTGVPVGNSFGAFDSVGPAINAAGQVAFRGILFDDLTNRASGDGIWLHQPDTSELELVARNGMPAAGLENVVYGETSPPLLSSNGAVTFTSQLAGLGVDATNNAALWSGTPDDLDVIARLGEEAPGTPDGVVFSEFTRFVTVNSIGQIAFRARISGPGIDGTNDIGIWAQNRQGVLQAIILEGTSLEVSPGVFKTVESAVVTSNQGDDSGYGGSLNNSGQLAFWASFTDDTQGLFVTNAVAVPEPSTLGLLTLAWLGAVGLRRPRR